MLFEKTNQKGYQKGYISLYLIAISLRLQHGIKVHRFDQRKKTKTKKQS